MTTNALAWLENLWLQEGRDDQWPESRLVAQTTLGVAEAACAFATAFLGEVEARLVRERVMQRKEARKGAFLTYRDEFAFVASMLTDPLLLVIVGQSGMVKSVDVCTPGEKPRVVDEDGAREAFDRMMAVVIDFESTRTVTAYCWKTRWKSYELREGVASPPPPPPPPPAKATGEAPAPPPSPVTPTAARSGDEETERRLARARGVVDDKARW